VQTNNFLLWGGSKTLMGYNKHFINNSFVYVDYSPSSVRGERPGSGCPRGEAGQWVLGVCATSIASSPFLDLWQGGLPGAVVEQLVHRLLPGSVLRVVRVQRHQPLWMAPSPYPMKGNSYYSQTGDYRMHCRGTTWNLTQAQSLGIDLGSTTPHPTHRG
jgi:hypothetical protein